MGESGERDREVLEATLAIAEAFDRGDLEGLLAAHYQGTEASAVPPGAASPLNGWEAVRRGLESRLLEFKHSRTTIDQTRVTIFGDLALITYRQRIHSRIHDIEFNWAGLVTDVLLRSQGRWLRLHHHASELSEPQR